MNRFYFIALLALLLGLVLPLAGCEAEPETEGEAAAGDMAEMHDDDTPDATALVMEPRIPVDAMSIEYNLNDDGTSYVGYVAAPVRPDSVVEVMGAPGGSALPAVVLVHEWWGLNDNVKAAARRLAGEGFRVLAVDLYGGQTGETPDEAQALMGQTMDDGDAIDANLSMAYRFLKERYEAPRVAVMGWCFGGRMALRAAVNMPTDLDAAVIYYGHVSGFSDAQLRALDMPIYAFFGADDTSIPVSDVDAFRTTLDDLGKDATVEVYDGAGHAFANPSGQNYVAEAARDAWDKTTAFLKNHLYPGSDAM